MPLLARGQRGIEKESLRVAQTGGIAQTPHPEILGSPLTHPWITTDFSEAMIELVTPPMDSVNAVLGFMQDLHLFVCKQLEDEFLWATSMPCILAGESKIPIARFGRSNAGLMKHVYRIGLGHRYGRVMQVISGVHFNYSLAEDFWPMYRAVLQQKGDSLQGFQNDAYMGLVRNIQRYGWLVPYLFGASPAVCKSFFTGMDVDMEVFDESTYFLPYATSLRMTDVGYQNSVDKEVGVKACYDSMDCYINSLTQAIETPAEQWRSIGVKVNGEYRQLSDHLLQIENEYYSSVRPKQLQNGLEKPTLALRRRGIRYVELRSLDVNAEHPLGVDEQQLCLLETFMLFCLMSASPVIGPFEQKEIDYNLNAVSREGRRPGFRLMYDGKKIALRQKAKELLDAFVPIADALDQQHGGIAYRQAVQQQYEKVLYPDLTPSGQMLSKMRDLGESFYGYARRLSQQHRRYFSEKQLSEDKLIHFKKEVQGSLERLAELESRDSVDFDTFLAAYMKQK